MKFTEARRTVHSLGFTLSVRDGEYKVGVPGCPDAAYFTNDMDDAVATAKVMKPVSDKYQRFEALLGAFGR